MLPEMYDIIIFNKFSTAYYRLIPCPWSPTDSIKDSYLETVIGTGQRA
jgi:hypothetical protein